MDSDLFHDLFHGCALQAYLDEALAVGGPPECEATRRRAYRYYEEALAERNENKHEKPRILDTPMSSR